MRPKSLPGCTLIAYVYFSNLPRTLPLLLQQAADAARAAVFEFHHAVRSQKARCEAAPDNPETRGNIAVEKEVALAIFEGWLRARKERTNKYIKRKSHQHHYYHHGPHDSHHTMNGWNLYENGG